jgi:hypothetical protein
MTQEVQNPETPPPSAAPPSRAKGVVWRVLAVAVIRAVTLAMAHSMRDPSGFGGGGRTGAAGGPHDAAPAPEPEPSAGQGLSPEETRKKSAAEWRARMAGVLMHAADEDGPYADPANQDPEARRRFLADIFGVPPNYPRNKVADDLVPKEAKILMVVDNPSGTRERMAILTVSGDIHQALRAFYNHYGAAGWAVPEQPDPSAQTDRGWLVRFTKGRSERLVYALQRQTGKETLVAVYDEPH